MPGSGGAWPDEPMQQPGGRGPGPRRDGDPPEAGFDRARRGSGRPVSSPSPAGELSSTSTRGRPTAPAAAAAAAVTAKRKADRLDRPGRRVRGCRLPRGGMRRSSPGSTGSATRYRASGPAPKPHGPLVLFVTEGPGLAVLRQAEAGTAGPDNRRPTCARVRARQRELGIPESFEWIEQAAPDFTAAAARAGLDDDRPPADDPGFSARPGGRLPPAWPSGRSAGTSRISLASSRSLTWRSRTRAPQSARRARPNGTSWRPRRGPGGHRPDARNAGRRALGAGCRVR